MTNSSTSKRFFVGLEGLRGLAACMVLVFHATWTHSLKDISIVQNSWLFVDLFFVLSGFVIANRYIGHMHSGKDKIAYGISRFFRIYPLHLFYLLLFVLLHFVVLKLSSTGLISGKMTETNEPFLTQLFANIFLLHSTGITPNNAFNLPSWSISAEAVAYFFFFLVSAIGLTNKYRPLLWAALGLIFGAILFSASKVDALDTTYQFGAVRAIFGFCLGVSMRGLAEHLLDSQLVKDNSNKFKAAQYLGFLLVLWILHVGEAGNPITFLAPFIFAFFITSLAVQEKGALNAVLTSKPFRFLGVVSYGVYLIHLLVIIVLKNVVDILGLVQGQQGLDDIVSPLVGNLMVIVVLASSLLGAWIINQIIEKPFIKLGKKLSAKLPSESPKSVKA